MKKQRPKPPIEPERLEASKNKFVMLLTLVFTTIVVYGVLQVVLYFEIIAIYWIYLGITLALIIAYLLYNRGMSRRNITSDMLPEDWTYEQKEEFISEAAGRMAKSKWLLMFILAFIITFGIDVVVLFYGDYFSNLFKT